MKDIFGTFISDKINNKFNLYIIDTSDHRYLCFIKDYYTEEVRDTNNLLRIFQLCDYIIKDGELVKSRTSEKT